MKDWEKELRKKIFGHKWEFDNLVIFIDELLNQARQEEREKACKTVEQFIDSIYILENNEGSLDDLLKKLKEL
jgi:hypothetical protein